MLREDVLRIFLPCHAGHLEGKGCSGSRRELNLDGTGLAMHAGSGLHREFTAGNWPVFLPGGEMLSELIIDSMGQSAFVRDREVAF